MTENRFIPVIPCPAPRMVQSDKWRKRPCVLRYRAFKDDLRRYITEVPVPLRITFILPMPESWSEKKKANHFHKPHQQKPDIDNLVKAFMDALLDDDSHVWSVKAEKYWGKEGSICVKV